ncbi:low density lipoprotein receptor adapter protein 1-like [Plodia interpunctella]|uniref:low density lipoprotein receptor adapter protein 1-like n=1 Tax=Plodia interpunctella TaxID=58824 RepID=UPI002367DB46|nr:low density lipoprotein receptor adapter protein 1-like [Plodia interpunctella]
MTTLLRKMWRTHTKHKKLSEEWALAECEGEGWWREAREIGRGHGEVRYAGAAPVERAASAPATALAVTSALHTANRTKKKLQRVNLDISPKGIIVTDADSQENVMSVSIYRISYCSADAANARVFAVVEGKSGGGSGGGSGAGETHVAHVFVCARRRHARALALALAHAFNDAYQEWQANQASSLHNPSSNRVNPWVQFAEESDDEVEGDGEQWDTAPPLVTFA